VQRFSITTSKSFKDVVAGLESRIGHPDLMAFRKNISAARTDSELQKIVQAATGSSGLMEFTRFDLGSGGPRSLRLVVGNPVIMKQMVKFVPDAGSYAPVTILVDERPDGVLISYDKIVSFLTSYGNAEALQVAKDLDFKV
jgi:Domain of unknown function DUF302